ncbi:MAG: hypothetical protein V3T17_19810 [Pseudomonadales bacterium]
MKNLYSDGTTDAPDLSLTSATGVFDSTAAIVRNRKFRLSIH